MIIRGLDREEMTSALRRKGQRIIPVKWDDYSDRYMHTYDQELQQLYAKWGRDYLQVSPWYKYKPAGEEAQISEYAKQRGEELRGFSPGYSDYFDEWNCRWKTTDADEVGANSIDHPYPSIDKALAAKIPDPCIAERLEPIRKAREEHSRDFIWAQIWLGPWETARAMLGTEESLTAIYTERVKAVRFFHRVFEHFALLIANICTLDVDMVGIGDDWGIERSLLIDPSVWVEVFKPLYRSIFSEIRKADKISLFHCCGCAEALYPHMIDIGVDVLHPLQPGPVDIDRVGKEYRGKVTFFGGLDTRVLLEKSTPKQVEQEVDHVIKTLGTPEGGLVVGASTTILSGTPIENVEAIFRRTRTYAWSAD